MYSPIRVTELEVQGNAAPLYKNNHAIAWREPCLTQKSSQNNFKY